MTDIKPNWVTIPQWYDGMLVGFTCKGLLRARLNYETMFIGYGASAGGLGARFNAYRNPKGTGQKHYAGRLIYEHRAQIQMQIAVLDLPPDKIEFWAEQLIEQRKPTWNVPPEHHRR